MSLFFVKMLSIEIISLCFERHIVMLNPSSVIVGEHLNRYYVHCVAHCDAHRFCDKGSLI